MDFSDLRAKYPQYQDMSDQDFADKFHAKYYSDMPKEDFYKKLNFQPQQQGVVGETLSNIGSEFMQGAKAVGRGVASTFEKPQPGASTGELLGKTSRDILGVGAGALQAGFAPVTGPGKTLETHMMKGVDPAKPLDIPIEAFDYQAPEVFPPGQYSGETYQVMPGTVAKGARIVAENAVLFPAASVLMRILGVTAGEAINMAKTTYAKGTEWGAVADEELMAHAATPEASAWTPEGAFARQRQHVIDTTFAAQERQAQIDKEFQTGAATATHTIKEPMVGPPPEATGEGVGPWETKKALDQAAQGRQGVINTAFAAQERQAEIERQTGGQGTRTMAQGTPVTQPGVPPSLAERPIPEHYNEELLNQWMRRPGAPDATADQIAKPRRSNTLGRFVSDESGELKTDTLFRKNAKPMPSQEDVRGQLQGYLQQGMDPRTAYEKVADDLGRHPVDVLNHLKGTLADSATTTAIDRISRGAVLDQNYPSSFNALVDALAGRDVLKFEGIAPPDPRQVYRVIDQKVPAISKDIGVINKVASSNNIVAANHFGSANNPITDAFSSQLTYLDDALRDHDWHSNIITHLNMKGDVKESLKSLQAEMGPLFDEFVDLHHPLAAASTAIREANERLAHAAEGSSRYRAIKDEIAGHQATLDADISDQLSPLYDRRDKILYGDAEAGTEGLAQRYANVRIKLAASGDARADAMLSAPEKEVTEQVKKFYQGKKDLLDKQGIRTRDDDYTNFVFRHGSEDPGAAPFANSMWYRKTAPTPAVLDFIQRTPGSKDWFPLLSQSLDAYIPSVNRKVNFTPFMDKWRPQVAELAKAKYPGASQWLSDFLKNQFSPEASTASQKVMNFYIGSQYFRTLFANASVPVLHAFKLLQASWWRGPLAFAQGTYRYGKGVGQVLTGLEGPERQALEFYVKLPQLMRTIEQQSGMAGAEYLKPSFWTKAGTAMTAMAEHVGNGISVMSTLEQAANRGIKDVGLIHSEVLDTMMRLDFRSFNMPEALRQHRAMGMFQNQPWKLTENKIDLFKGMLQGKADAFGDPYLHKFVRMAAVLGGAWYAGDKMGVDLSKHLFHLPYGLYNIAEAGIQTARAGGSAGDVGMAMLREPIQTAPPPVQMAQDLAKGGVGGAISGQVVPAVSDKIARLIQQDPSLRYQSAEHEFVGLPKLGAAEEQRDMRERKRLLDAYKHPIAAEYQKSPTRRLLESQGLWP
jgi:hypothetical protein